MAAAVFAWRDSAELFERLGEMALIPEAGLDGDLGDELVGCLQQPAGSIESDCRDVASGRDAERARELTAEICLRGCDHACELVDCDVFSVMLTDEFCHRL